MNYRIKSENIKKLPENSALSVEELYKVFYISPSPWKNLLGDLFPNLDLLKGIIALENINFSVNKGEIFGIIGRNGSGKSTILRILAKTLKNYKGKVNIQGKTAALLDVDAGFISELSGLENIKLTAPLWGYSKDMIPKLTEKIQDFSELGEAFYDPIKSYSMGMLVRLGFSMAIFQDFDILLVDEILSVGDMGFSAKCIRKMRELKNAGKTIVVASHNLATIAGLCDKALVLSKGQQIYLGSVEKAIGAYWKIVERESGLIHKMSSTNNAKAKENADSIDKKAIITQVDLLDKDGKSVEIINSKEVFIVKILVQSKENLENILIRVQFLRNDGYMAWGINTARSKKTTKLQKGKNIFELRIESLNFLSGDYFVNTGIWPDENASYAANNPLFVREMIDIIRVNSPREFGAGLVAMPYNWNF